MNDIERNIQIEEEFIYDSVNLNIHSFNVNELISLSDSITRILGYKSQSRISDKDLIKIQNFTIEKLRKRGVIK